MNLTTNWKKIGNKYMRVENVLGAVGNIIETLQLASAGTWLLPWRDSLGLYREETGF
jgi:hypothetical protein